jgi:two-component system sensor histidine kinase BaeS
LTIETVKSLQTEVVLLQKLVDDLYDLSLSDLGALTYRKVDVDLADVLHMTVDAFRQRLTERDLTLDMQISERPLMVLTDENRLRQLFNNLMENMVRYTDAGGRVQISCRWRNGEAVIDFQDSKPGVAPEHLPRLFERFFRSDSARNRARGGAGLGLATCRNIVEAHGGRIAAQPSPLGGLWIAVSFPLIPA